MHEQMPPGFPQNTIKASIDRTLINDDKLTEDQVQRALCAVELLFPQQIEATLKVLYHAFFVEHRDVTSNDILSELLTVVHGAHKSNEIIAKVSSDLEPDVFCAKHFELQSTSDEAKRLLLKNTEQALQDGSFGLPYFVGMSSFPVRCGKYISTPLILTATNTEGNTEYYWGFDHIGQVTEHLGLAKPQPSTDDNARWRALL